MSPLSSKISAAFICSAWLFDIWVTCLFSHGSAEEGFTVLSFKRSLSYRKMWKIQTWRPRTKDVFNTVPNVWGRWLKANQWAGNKEEVLDKTERECMQILHLLEQFQTLSIQNRVWDPSTSYAGTRWVYFDYRELLWGVWSYVAYEVSRCINQILSTNFLFKFPMIGTIWLNMMDGHFCFFTRWPKQLLFINVAVNECIGTLRMSRWHSFY